MQPEACRSLYGYYPELIQADKIYNTTENRKWCKQNNIRLTVTPKGKPVEKPPYQKRIQTPEILREKSGRRKNRIGQAGPQTQ